MNLYLECKKALQDHFSEIEDWATISHLLSKFPINGNYIDWSEMNFQNYHTSQLQHLSLMEHSTEIYVVVDDQEIPVFKTNFKLLCEHIDDVLALSPKLMMLNNALIMEPIFPTYYIRVGHIKK